MKFSILSFITAFFFIISSCGDPCDDVDCGMEGICIDGTCLCTEGYEGTNCEIEIRAKFVGNWMANDYSCSGAAGVDYRFSIERGPTVDDLIFFNESKTLEFPATLNGNVITIALQEYDSTTLQGTLTLNPSDNTLALEFEIDNSIAVLDCTATARKQ